MRLRSIRARVLVLVILPLLSLVGVYAFATTLTARDAITLARALSIRNTVDDPIGLFAAQVQTERLLATMYLVSPTPQNVAALTAQEVKTNKFLAVLRAAAGSASTRNNASPQVKDALAALLGDTAQLPVLRQQISSHTIGAPQAQKGYSAIVAAGYDTIVNTVLEMPNVHLETQALAVMRVTQGAEILLQEQALLIGDVMAHSFSAGDHHRFAELVGEHRGIVADAMPGLDPVYRSYYRQSVSPPAAAALIRLENAVINTRAGVVPRVPLPAYEQSAGAVADGLGTAGFRAGRTLADYGHQVAIPVDLRLILAGGIGLFAIVVSVLTSIWIGRGLVSELGGLRSAALELADVRLPQLVTRLSSGEDVGMDDEVPFPHPGHDEIGQVRQAFNSVQRTAIEAAVGQARLRAGIATIFRNLARRSQSLLHRQLAMLDDLELRAARPEELESLFHLDHLTTRMRRHAEGLVVLAGDRPGRAWKNPVPLADVLRAAVAEVEDYRRVRVITRSRAALAGRAVADVIHLLAELIENATIFSPPNTPVRVIGDLVARGFAVEIEDRGLGITGAAVAKLNAKLAAPPQVDLATTEQLGLYVAARLASEYGVRVTLRDSPFGGTTAIVLIPPDLVVSEESYSADPDAGLANELAIQATGRHAARGTGWDVPGGDAPAGGPGPEAGLNGGASPATMPARTGTAEPFTTGTPDAGAGLRTPGTPETRESPVTPGPPEAGNGQRDTGAEPNTATMNLTELGLPRRTRQASLAPELRDPPPSQTAGTESGGAGGRSPGETRDALTALQRGWERGRADSAATWTSAGASPSETGQRPGPDDDGGTPPPGTSEQEGSG
jgi:signal transduction histidine kinase